MITEFQQLAKKVDKLVELIRALRNENAELRAQLTQLAATNEDLTARIQQAHERVSAVLGGPPFTESVASSESTYTEQEL
jgi:cell division protein ZapB